MFALTRPERTLCSERHDRALRAPGDEGARRVLLGETVTQIALPGQHALIDLDTPAAWSAWRAGRAQT